MPVFECNRAATKRGSLASAIARALAIVVLLGSGLLPAAGVLGQATPVPAGYTIHELPTLGGDGGSVVEINNAGIAVGWSELHAGEDTEHATLWAGGAPIDLGTLGGDNSGAMAINDAGVIVGYAETAGGERHAVIWRDEVMTDLGTLGGANSGASAVNADGAVVGRSQTASGDDHAFLWQDGEMRDLGTLGGATSVALTISDNGVVYGTSDTANGPPQAAMWSGSLISALGTLGGEAAYAMAANPSGLLVGFAADPDGAQYALVWRDGVRIPERLDPDDPTESVAIAVNDAGDISGSIAASTPEMRAVVWRDGERILLPGFGDDMSGSFSITNDGVLGGYAADASGRHRPVLWVPASAPAPAALGGAPQAATPANAATPVSLGGESSAAARDAEGGDISTRFTVESHDIFFAPAEIEAPANTDVTILLPNLGRAPHNFSIDALGISVDIAPGMTEEVVVNAPAGEYEFYCTVPGHTEAGMVGTLIVREDITAAPVLTATPAAAASASPTPAPRSFVWDQVDVTVRLRQDGSFRVTERDRVTFSGGPFRTGYREIPLARIERFDDVWVGEVDGASITPYRFVAPGAFSNAVPNTYTWRQVGPNLRIDWSFPETTSATRTFQIGFDAFGALRVYDNAGAPYQQISWIGVDEILTATAPVNEASLTFVLPRVIDPSRTIIQGPGSNRSANHTDDGQTWVWRASDLGPGESLWASLRFPPQVSAEAPSWQEASDRARDAGIADEVAITPVPLATPAPQATPVAGPVDAPPCREVMENDFPGQQRELLADCTTDRPIFVPEAWVFDGGGHTIYARDPDGDRLTGGVVIVSGDGSTVRNLTIDGSGLTAPCLVDFGATALAGVLVRGRGGEVTGVAVHDLQRALPDAAARASSDNEMNSCGEGITVSGSAAEAFVVENTITNAGFAGILVDAGTASISHNTIDGVGDVGILAMSGANVRVTPGNRITHAESGILLEDPGTGGRIAGNTVTSTIGAGIGVILGARASLADNVVEDAYYGIVVHGSAAADITANTIRRTQDSGIFVAHAGTTVTVQDTTIESSDSDGIWVQEGAQASILGNTVTGAARHGIVVVHGGTRATIERNIVTDAAEDGILLSGGARASIAENRVTGPQRGIEANGAGTTATITGNTIERVGVVGITINQGASAPDVSGNTVSEARFGIVTLSAGTTSTVTGNTVSDLSGGGFTVEDGAAAVLRGNHVSQAPGGVIVTGAGASAELVDNRIEDTVTLGISINDGARATVSGNTLLQPGVTGIDVDDAGPVTLEGNTIEDARGAGIRLQRVRTGAGGDVEFTLASHDIYYDPDALTIPADTDVTLRLPNVGASLHNVTIDALGIDVDISPGETVNVVINAPAGTYEIRCTVPGHREAGQVATLNVEPSTDVEPETERTPVAPDEIRDNAIRGGVSGILLTGFGATAAVTENTIAGTSGAGIAIGSGANATVEGNAIAETGVGIALEHIGTSGTLADNRISDPGERGIYIHNGAEATVHENTVERAGTDGIAVNGRGSAATLTGNVVTDAADNGIVVGAAATATIEDGNSVSGGKWGIAILSDATVAEVRGNQVHDASNQSISVLYGAQATIADNTVAGGDSGIYVRYLRSRAVITGNTVSAKRRGIYVWEEATAERIAGNTVTDSGSGIEIEGRGVRAVVADNHVSNVAGEGIAVRNGATAEVSGNRVRDANNWGIFIAGQGATATITGNEIAEIDGIGIQISQGATGTVRDNQVRAIADTGIRVMDAVIGVEVSENTLRQAGTIGIEAYGSVVEIRDNTIAGSAFAGILLGVDAEVEVTGNTIVGPAEPEAADPGPFGIRIQRDVSGVVRDNRISGVGNDASGPTCAIRIDASAPAIRVAGNRFPPPGNDQDICDERESAVAATPAPAATPVAALCEAPEGLGPNVAVVTTRTTLMQKAPDDATPPRHLLPRGTRLLVAPSVTMSGESAASEACGWLPVVAVETGQPGFVRAVHIRLDPGSA